jgi:hypothetical protein
MAGYGKEKLLNMGSESWCSGILHIHDVFDTVTFGKESNSLLLYHEI